MKITLVGYMGAGKSSVGRELAAQMQLPFVDLDAEIKAKTGYSISETIFNKGEIFFRKLERETLLEILEKPEFILATGGGTPCYFDNIEKINRNSASAYLRYSASQLSERLKGTQRERPLITHLSDEGLQEFVAKHLFERTVYYEKATFVLEGNNQSPEQLAKEIQNII